MQPLDVDSPGDLTRLETQHETKGLMKKYMIYTMAAFFAMIAVSIAAPDKDAIIAKEKAAWQAFKDKKPDDFKKVVSADVATVYPDGMHNMQQELDLMPKTDMKSFSFSDVNVTFPNPKTAIITYKATVEATQEGKDMSGTYNVGSVWHMVHGQWMGIFHSEAKAEPATKPAG
jgi:uncharacterized protein DUF4440